MAARAASNGDMKIFAISAVVQRETGGNLAEILDKIAHTVRERYKFFGKVRALTAEGRASAIVVGGLPFVVAFALVLLNPGYIVRLVDNPLGRLVLALAAVFWFVGEALMIRLARVEF
jgi:tight adherence protein B